MWNQFESLSEEKIFKNTFSINSLFKIGKGDEVSVDCMFFFFVTVHVVRLCLALN